MGAGKSTGAMKPAVIKRFFDPADTFRVGRLELNPEGGEAPGCDALAAYCILGAKAGERVEAASAALQRLQLAGSKADAGARAKDRSLGCMLGNIVSDALGAPLEFSPVRYGVAELTGMDHDKIWQKSGYNSFNLKPGQWTDDGSMALCIMDSLLCCNKFDPYDLRQRFHGWNTHGYNNAFGRDAARSPASSVGLGGNISMSMTEWEEKGTPATTAGNKYTSGNGSVMRNGAVPVWFRNNIEEGMDAATRQSRTTHAGDEAAELCRLMTFICIKFINGAGREFLEDVKGFQSPSYGVSCLAKAECEKKHEQNSDPVFGGLERRRWNWKTPDYQYCAFRAQDNPGYCGSYAMDAVSMALHCVYSTSSFEEATLKAANLCGDADTVCAVTGQLAGALYGISAIPQSWITRLQQWDDNTILARALMLYDHEPIGAEALSDTACASAGLLGKACTRPGKP